MHRSRPPPCPLVRHLAVRRISDRRGRLGRHGWPPRGSSRSSLTGTVVHPLDGIANDLLPGTVISSSRIFRAVSLGTCLRITSRTRSTVLLLAATRHLLQHLQGHRPFTLAVTGRASRAPRTLYGRPYSTRGAL